MGALHGHRLLGAGAGNDIRGLPLPLQGLLDGGRIGGQVGQLVEHVALADDGVHQVAVPWRQSGWMFERLQNNRSCAASCCLAFPTIKLVLDYIIESLEEEEDKVVVLGGGEEEPAGGEGLQQVEQFVGSHHGEALQVRRHCKTEDTSRRVLHNEMISASVAVSRLGRRMALQRLTIHNYGEKAVEQGLETLVARGDDLMKHLRNQSSGSGEHRLCRRRGR